MSKQIKLSDLPFEKIPSGALVVFGGTFDPIHEGHVSVIRELSKFFRSILIAPTGQNPWKDELATDFSLRRQMLGIVLKAEGIPYVEGLGENSLSISDFSYIYAEELILKLRASGFENIYWAVGEDIANEVHKWRNWDTLDIKTIVAPIVFPVHSTDVRNRTKPIHPAIREFARNNGLYQPL